MEYNYVNYALVNQLSKRDKDYLSQEPDLEEFVGSFPSHEAIRKQIDFKKGKTDRALLYNILQEQLQGLKLSEKAKRNLELLKEENCYTIISAHQPSLFTGPLYYIFKILSSIKLAKDLKIKYPEFEFVPIFIVGAEDHDFDEINHTKVFGKTVIWERESYGPVGRLSLEGLEALFEELNGIIGDRNQAIELFDFIKTQLKRNQNYVSFAQAMTNQIFTRFGLLPVSMDHTGFKRKMIDIFKKEIFDHVSYKTVIPVQKQLAKKQYDAQAYVRPINIFYMTDEMRSRIEYQDGTYKIVGTNFSFSKDTLLTELESHPERFSPNVILRPIYQELIFPNLAFIGGGGEMAYWMERRQQFHALDIPFPIIIRRNSALLVPGHVQKKMEKMNLNLDSIFLDEHQLIKAFVMNETGDANFNYQEELNAIKVNFEKISVKAGIVDPTISKSINAEYAKVQNSIQQFSKKVERKIKSNSETQVNQIKKIKATLFPSNGLQERHDNIIQYFAQYGTEILDDWVDYFDPMNRSLLAILLN